MQFKNKQEFLDYVEGKTFVKLENDPDEHFNRKKHTWYGQLPAGARGERVMECFAILNICVTDHFPGKYWVRFNEKAIQGSTFRFGNFNYTNTNGVKS